MFVNGQGRRIFCNTTVVVSNGTLPTSINFGGFLASEVVGILGMVKCDSNFTALLQLQYQSQSGTTLVTSTIAISSGTIVNELNPGMNVAIGITGIASNTIAKVFLTGLPIR